MFRSNLHKIFFYSVYYGFFPLFWSMLKNPREGAQTTIYTVLEDNDKLEKGAYYADCKPK